MVRSLWKGIFIDFSLWKNFILKKKNYIQTWSRRSTISKSMLNCTFYVHNGKTFIKLLITPEMIGFKLGDFAFTRKIILRKYTRKRKKKWKKKKEDTKRKYIY